MVKSIEVRPDWEQVRLLIVILMLLAAVMYAAWSTGRKLCVDRRYLVPETYEPVIICVVESDDVD